jgi:hypothetical protein
MLIATANLAGGGNRGGFGHADGFKRKCAVQQLGHCLS